VSLLSVENISKRYANGVLAVDDVSLSVAPGEIVGIVGESGCGKSTTAKIILKLLEPDRGTVRFAGHDLADVRGRRLRSLRARFQLVPQSPQTALDPRMTVGAAIAFNLRVHGWSRAKIPDRVDEMLDQVGIAPRLRDRYPHELSGGQVQRVAIARALATGPDLLVCDEAVSALDKSVQAQVLNLLARLQRERGIAILFISHDLGVVEHLCDRVAVMYLGRVVEEGPAEEIWARPRHPYTQALLSAIPGESRSRIVLAGDPPDPADAPAGCAFHTRCPRAVEECARRRPDLLPLAAPHRDACALSTSAVPV
jgi:oligopeptide/dipeptide ABC transporter, ATP-binding protein, C-terminal domain